MPKCKFCETEILWVTTPKGEQTPVDAAKTRVAQLLELDDGSLKIGEVHVGHVSHLTSCPSSEHQEAMRRVAKREAG